MDEMDPSPALETGIKALETCRLIAYWDVNGWSIGWGYHGPEITEGMHITQPMADSLFQKKIDEAATAVRFLCEPLKLDQGKFDALVDFVYNLGAGKLSTSTLLKLLREGNIAAAAAEFPKWNHKRVNGVEIEDVELLKRRMWERRIFLGG